MKKTYAVHNSPHADTIDQKSLIWAALYNVAKPIVEAYHSDFYHDALWIEEHITNQPVEFYYCVGDSGTSIVAGMEEPRTLRNTALSLGPYRPYIYCCRLTKPESEFSQQWLFSVECIAQPN